MKHYKKHKVILENFLFPLMLLLLPLWNMNVGIDLADTTYSLANYEYFGKTDQMWFFSTFLANVIGLGLTKLPLGNTLLGINFYTSLFISLLALLSYFYLKKKFPAPLVFWGEACAIFLAWCPSTILYNYATYLFVTFSLLFLMQGLKKRKRFYLVLSGVFLGLNLFVRFPNVTEVGFIVAVWGYGFFKKSKFVKIYQDTLACLAGYLIAVITMFVTISLLFGANQYIQAIKDLFSMNTEAVSYTPLSMILSIVKSYMEGGKWLLFILAAGALGVALFALTPNAVRKIMLFFYGVGLVIYIRWLQQQGMFDFNYRYYHSVYLLVVVFLIISILLLIWEIIKKKTTADEKLLALVLLLLIGITPLGSNNHLYPNLNFLFLLAPFTFSKLYEWIAPLFEKREVQVLDSLRVLVLVFVAVLSFQTAFFGLSFVFNEGYAGEKRDANIENSVIMNGMTTTLEKSQDIQELQNYLQEYELFGQNVLLHGNIPGISYLFEMPSVISNPWSDLPSFPTALFSKEMQEIKEGTLVIVSKSLGDWLIDKPIENQELKQSYQTNQKKIILKQFIEERNYVPIFENTGFMVLQEDSR
jgi:hypothetical protein